MNIIEQNLIEAKEILELFISDKSNINSIEKAGKAMVSSINHSNKIISCGNGGSMSDAMHFAEELTGRFRENRRAISAVSISDPTHISCTANDFGYDYVFSRFIEANGRKGDCLLAISTSGNSKNVLEAVKIAKTMGIIVIALTGKNGGELSNICDIEIRAPFSKYADRVQEIHIKVIHSLIHYIEVNIIE